jgi:hypothetical protein
MYSFQGDLGGVSGALDALNDLNDDIKEETGKSFPTPFSSEPSDILGVLSSMLGYLEGLIEVSEIGDLKKKYEELEKKARELEKGAGTYCALIGEKCEFEVEVKNRCFIIYDYDFGKLGERISQVVKKCGLEPRIAGKIDLAESASILCRKVCKEIRSSKLCIADVSKENTNVGLEVGLAWRYGKPVIVTMDLTKRDKPPSDLSGFTLVLYKNLDELMNRLSRVMMEFSKEKLLPEFVAEAIAGVALTQQLRQSVEVKRIK